MLCIAERAEAAFLRILSHPSRLFLAYPASGLLEALVGQEHSPLARCRAAK